MGIQAVLEAIDLVRAGNPPHIAQDDAQATYESWCRKADAEIDWSKSVEDVYNLIRGTNPQPGAWTTYNGQQLQIYDCVKITGDTGTPGEVTAVDENSFTVSATGGLIDIRRVKPEGERKISAGEFAGSQRITIGTILGA